MYVYTYVCIYVYMVLCNAAFTQGNMYCMALWLYIYMYGPRSVPQKGNFVKQFTQQKSVVKLKTFSASCLCENVFIIFSLDFFQKIWYNKV